MSITGNIKTMQLAELLQWLSQSQKTGTLVFDNGQVEKRVFFRDGMVISSASTDPKEYLGHFLVSHGFITEEQLSEGMKRQAAKKVLLGRILVEMGAIAESDVHRMLRMKAEESIYEIFTWAAGDFRFIEEVPVTPMVQMTLDVTALVLEAMRRLDDWKRIREVIHSPRAVPVSLGHPLDPELDAGARLILSMVNDDRTVEEICLQSHSSDFYASQVLFDQWKVGKLKVVNPKSLSASATLPIAVDAPALLRLGQTYLQNGDYERAVRHHRAARSLDPDNKHVLGTVQKAEERMKGELEKMGVALNSIPTLSRKMEELTTVAISPQEGFILSRINGNYDIQSILKISPMPPLEAQIVFWKLLRAGHITLRVPPASTKSR
jgi:hypothetical protein